MTGTSFDGLTRLLGRRRALQALGTATVAAIGGVSLVDAKNNNKNKKRKKKQQRIDEQSLALCAGQVTQCDGLIAENCGNDAECLQEGQACCNLLADCNFAATVTCLQAE